MYFLVKNKEEFEERMKKTKRESEWVNQEIKTFTALSFNSDCYLSKGILAWYENKDVIAFKKYLSISGKLKILGHSRIDWAYHGDIVLQFFPEIMSDNPLIHQFLINNLNNICLEDKPDYHKGWGTTLFMNRNLLLALKGDWKALKKRSLIFLNDIPSGHKKYILTHEFYLALSEANVDEMKKALKPIMDPKKGKILARDTFYDLEFYLQPQLLLFAKIASIHGYNLEIDLDIAPKELIKYQPLTVKEYEEADKEYPLISKYDFKEPFINWIAKMTQIEEEYKSGRK